MDESIGAFVSRYEALGLTGTPATLQEVGALERELGVVLPAAYKARGAGKEVAMSEHVTPDPPLKRPESVLPDRRLQRFLDPGEVVRWWEGPNQGPWMRWATKHVQLLVGLGLLCFFLCPLGGMGLCALTGVNPGVGCAIGAALGVVAMLVACNVAGAVERQIWLAVTDRRLLVVQGQKKLQDYDLDLLRRALATAGGSAPAGDDRVVDLGKLPRTALGPADGITDADSVLALARLVGRRAGPG